MKKKILVGLCLLVAMANAMAQPATSELFVSSWQRDNPVLSGALSALTLSLWPRQFGGDQKPSPAQDVETMPVAVHSAVLPAAEASFRKARGVAYVLELLSLLWLVWRWTQRRKCHRPAN